MIPGTSNIRPAPLFLLLASLAFATPAAERAPKGKAADSLKTLQVLIRAELKPENRVFVLKDRAAWDSLLGVRPPATRLGLNRLLEDSASVAEVRNKEEFHRYWRQAEAQSGFKELRGQFDRRDLDRTLIPKKYLFDSTVIVYPGWIILRRK